MTLSADGKNWSVQGQLASIHFVIEPRTQTAAFTRADLIVAAEEMGSEHLAQIIAGPVQAKRGIIARLLSLRSFTSADVLSAFAIWSAESSAPDPPDLPRPLVILAPSFERQCLRALKAANIRGVWKAVGFSYHRTNAYSTLISELERVIGRSPNVSANNPMSVGFMSLKSISFVFGLEKAVLSLQNNLTELYKLYPELCKKIDPTTIREAW